MQEEIEYLHDDEVNFSAEGGDMEDLQGDVEASSSGEEEDAGELGGQQEQIATAGVALGKQKTSESCFHQSLRSSSKLLSM